MPGDLNRFFAAYASYEFVGPRPKRPGGPTLIVSRPLYDSYLFQYRQSLRLLDALQAVLDDGEHKLIMEEGRRLNYKMPDEDVFERLVKNYRRQLMDIDAFYAETLSDNRVRLKMDTALKMEKLCAYNDRLTRTIFEAVWYTDYLRRFTDWKKQGFPYAGPAALQEACDVMVAAQRSDKAMAHHTRTLRQKRLWDRLFASPT